MSLKENSAELKHIQPYGEFWYEAFVRCFEGVLDLGHRIYYSVWDRKNLEHVLRIEGTILDL
jgi:hypothetical protein